MTNTKVISNKSGRGLDRLLSRYRQLSPRMVLAGTSGALGLPVLSVQDPALFGIGLCGSSLFQVLASTKIRIQNRGTNTGHKYRVYLRESVWPPHTEKSLSRVGQTAACEEGGGKRREEESILKQDQEQKKALPSHQFLF